MRAASLRVASAEDSIISAFPYVKSARARFAPPGMLDIEIEERTKSVVVPYLGSGLLVDEEGFVVDIVKDVQLTELPVVSGLDFDYYQLGSRLEVRNIACAEAMITIVNALRQADREGDELAWEIRTIDVSDKKNILLKLKSGLVVNLGSNEDIYYCINATKEIVFRGLGHDATGLVDFSSGPKPIYIPKE
jgi:cell division septal protein FtsQ